MKPTVAVLGCAGYIGHVLCNKLLEAGYYVRGMDNFHYFQENSIFHLLSNDYFEFHKLDVTHIENWTLLSSCDIIIPLAAIVGDPACKCYNEDFVFRHNAGYIYELIQHLSPKQKIIFPNTNSGYGIGSEVECFETDKLNPISWYGKTKCFAEDAVLQRENSAVFRLATVCGVSPRMRFDLMVNDFFRTLFFKKTLKVFEPEFRRNFVGIKDVASAFEFAIRKDLLGVYNLGLPTANMNKLDLALMIANYLELGDEAITIGQGTDPDKRDYIVSNRKVLDAGFKFTQELPDVFNDLEKLCLILTHSQTFGMTNA